MQFVAEVQRPQYSILMILENFYLKAQNNIQVSREQASNFAKNMARDFNPIHDTDSKRFCVPGDLLFALVLNHYGLSQHMKFNFSGLVGDGKTLHFQPSDESSISIKDDRDKEYLNVERSGEQSHDPQLISNLTQNYVAFSGQTFPHVLVPLMVEQQVMINPDRPLVIYESMEIDLQELDLHNPDLVLVDSSLSANGKRGKVILEFALMESDRQVGRGYKNMVLSGLRPYQKEQLDALVDFYEERKESFAG